MREDVSGSRGPSLHPVAVTPLLKLVGSGGTAVKPTELLQAVGDVIVDGVYSAGEARERLLSATRGTSYLQLNKQK